MENTKKEEKMVQVPADQLQSIMERLEKMEKGAGAAIKPKRVNEHTAKLRLWNGKLVVGVEKVYQVLNQNTQQMEDKIDLVMRDGDKLQKDTADYLNFLNQATPIKVKILEQKAENVTTIENTINLVDSKDDRIYMDRSTDLEVTSVVYVSKVEVMEGDFIGETFRINNKYLNI